MTHIMDVVNGEVATDDTDDISKVVVEERTDGSYM